jgi:hypothetical protein
VSKNNEIEITFGTGGGEKENKVLFSWEHRVKILLFFEFMHHQFVSEGVSISNFC